MSAEPTPDDLEKARGASGLCSAHQFAEDATCRTCYGDRARAATLADRLRKDGAMNMEMPAISHLQATGRLELEAADALASRQQVTTATADVIEACREAAGTVGLRKVNELAHGKEDGDGHRAEGADEAASAICDAIRTLKAGSKFFTLAPAAPDRLAQAEEVLRTIAEETCQNTEDGKTCIERGWTGDSCCPPCQARAFLDTAPTDKEEEEEP